MTKVIEKFRKELNCCFEIGGLSTRTLQSVIDVFKGWSFTRKLYVECFFCFIFKTVKRGLTHYYYKSDGP